MLAKTFAHERRRGAGGDAEQTSPSPWLGWARPACPWKLKVGCLVWCAMIFMPQKLLEGFSRKTEVGIVEW